jgi:hypothetical protein
MDGPHDGVALPVATRVNLEQQHNTRELAHFTPLLLPQQYEDAEEVYLWVNKVGPFPNPQETYPYYSLPFCHPKELIHSDTGHNCRYILPLKFHHPRTKSDL